MLKRFLFVLLAVLLVGCSNTDKGNKDILLAFSEYPHESFRDLALFDLFNPIVIEYYNGLIAAFNASDKQDARTLICENNAAEKLRDIIDNYDYHIDKLKPSQKPEDPKKDLLELALISQKIAQTSFIVAWLRAEVISEEGFIELRQNIVDTWEYFWDGIAE